MIDRKIDRYLEELYSNNGIGDHAEHQHAKQVKDLLEAVEEGPDQYSKWFHPPYQTEGSEGQEYAQHITCKTQT